MTTLIIDDQTIDFQTDKQDTVFDIIAIAQEQLWDESSEISSIKINQKQISPLTEENLKSINANDLVIEVTLTRNKQVPDLNTVLEHAVDYLKNLPAQLEKLAGEIRSEDPSSSFTSLKEFLESISLVLDLVKTVHEHPRCSKETQSHIQSFSPEVLEVLKEINESQSENDLILLSDLIEYELPEITGEIGDILNKFRETL
jgi:hypothetical protein